MVADLLQLALAAAGRLCSDSSAGGTSGGAASAAAQAQRVDDDQVEGRRAGTSPILRVDSLRHFCKELGFKEDGLSLNTADGVTGVKNCSGTSRDLPLSAHPDEPSLEDCKDLGMIKHRLDSTELNALPFDGCGERLREFLRSQGKSWEVNNCSIDGEGRCFYTVTQIKAPSPVEQRGQTREFRPSSCPDLRHCCCFFFLVSSSSRSIFRALAFPLCHRC